MPPKKPQLSEFELFQSRLDNMLDPEHPLFPAIRDAEDITIREYRQELNRLALQWGLGG